MGSTADGNAAGKRSGSRHSYLQTIGRLKPGVTLAQAEAELNTIIARLAQPISRNRGHQSSRRAHAGCDHLFGNAKPALWALFAAPGCCC